MGLYQERNSCLNQVGERWLTNFLSRKGWQYDIEKHARLERMVSSVLRSTWRKYIGAKKFKLPVVLPSHGPVCHNINWSDKMYWLNSGMTVLRDLSPSPEEEIHTRNQKPRQKPWLGTS